MLPSASAAASPSFFVGTCPNPEGDIANTCLGTVQAGTYTTKTFYPYMTYTVPAGWSDMEDLPGNFVLIPPGATLDGINAGTSDYLGVYAAVAAPDHCLGQPSDTVPQTFDGLLGWLKHDPAIIVSNVKEVTIGGLSGTVLDTRMRGTKGDGCPDGVWADLIVGVDNSSLVHSVGPDPATRTRLYLLRNGTEVLAIEVADVPNGQSSAADWFKAATPVVQSLSFSK
ncbi:MAG TPA: hypothetical protein VKR21_16485 [Solirubrobacteraceae bacterium]|nr:hypothetical protein [Solirubrobacteraceae bacterium]